MINQRVAENLLQMFVILLGVGLSLAQDNSITFLPDIPLCIGEEVQMICYVVPPSGTSFIFDAASISLNRSLPVLFTTFNALTLLGGVDTTRYTADTAELTTNNSRPGVRITISDYQATDGSVVFGCAGLFSIANTSDVLISDSPQSLAAPPSPPVSLTAVYNSPTCSGTVQLAWTPGASDRDIEMYFLSLNGVLIASLGPVTSYNHPTTLQRDMVYTYSVVAMSCAGNSTETNASSISVEPPSSPVVTVSQPDNDCSNTVISWPTPSSNRTITLYSVYRNNTPIYNGLDNQYTDNTQLSISTVYEYSVVAISCVGTSTAGVKSVSVGVPSPPNVTLGQSDSNACSGTQISWAVSDKLLILTYSVFRDSTLIYDGEDNQFTDITQLDVNTVYEYSVVAISCAGTSTGVNSTSIGNTSLATYPPFSISYDNTTNELFVNWTLNQPTQPIDVTYSLRLEYVYTQRNKTYPRSETKSFSQISTDTEYTLSLTPSTSFSEGSVAVFISATLSITHQCTTPFSDGIELNDNTSSTFTITFPAFNAALVGGVVGGVGGVLVIGISGGAVIIFVILVKKKEFKKSKSNSVELEEQPTYSQVDKSINKSKPSQEVKMEGFYADIDHMQPKPDTLKRAEPVEETLYSRVQPAIDGPSH